MTTNNFSVSLLEKRGNLKGFSDEQKEDFINTCKSFFVFYDPYKDLLINPISSKTYYPKTLQRLYLDSKINLEKKLMFKLPSDEEIEEAQKKLYSRKRLAYIIQEVIKYLKLLGLITICVLGYYVDYRLGLSIGLYLIYFDFNMFDNVNGLIGRIESPLMTSIFWQKKRNLYFFGSFFILLTSFVFLYLYTESIWVPAAILIIQKWLLVNPVTQFITSSFFRGNKLIDLLKEEHINQVKCAEFLDENPLGIKINEIIFEKTEYGFYEQYRIWYETVNNDSCPVNLLIYSKKRETLLKENQDLLDSLPVDDYFQIKPLMTDTQFGILFPQEKLLTTLEWLESSPFADFYFENITNNPAFSYFLISKDSDDFLFEFDDKDIIEGSFSNNIKKCYHENGQLSSTAKYKNGIQEGDYKWYHETGELMFECMYKNGCIVPGNILIKHKNGTKNITGALREKNGEFPKEKELYPGNPEHDSEFRIGVWKNFDENGNLLQSVHYKENGEMEILFNDPDYKGINVIMPGF